MTEPVLILRTCAPDMTAHGGFVWPEAGPVAAPDWDPAPECGNGLHGLLWGEGSAGLMNWAPDARWLVVAVDPATIVDLDGKVKFPAGEVVHCGDRLSATAFLASDPRAAGRAIHGGTATAGYGGTATAGDGGTATAGDGGTATAGYGGTATAGYRGTATAGDEGTVVLRRWDRDARRWRLVVGYIGEDGLEANVAYRLTEAGEFEAVEA
jgi:hypothetical protein